MAARILFFAGPGSPFLKTQVIYPDRGMRNPGLG
jgi:hypothetical protein